MSFKTIQSKSVYQGKVFDVRQDQVELPDGHLTALDVVEHNGAVTLIPIDEQGQIWFVRQYRHPAQDELLELPAGTLENNEDPEKCAHREVREEIGMSVGRLEKIGEFFMAPGYSTEYMYVYLARELSPAPLPGDEDEFLQVEKFPIEKVFEMAEQGQFKDSKTLAALYLAQRFL